MRLLMNFQSSQLKSTTSSPYLLQNHLKSNTIWICWWTDEKVSFDGSALGSGVINKLIFIADLVAVGKTKSKASTANKKNRPRLEPIIEEQLKFTSSADDKAKRKTKPVQSVYCGFSDKTSMNSDDLSMTEGE